MKMILGLFMLVLSVGAFASKDVQTFTYDGSQDSIEMILKAEKTHTEYRYEHRWTTCWREEVVGYRTTCSAGPQPICHSMPIYRSVSYPCQMTVRIPYEVKDFDVDARVSLDVTKLPEAVTAGETFKVTLDGDKLSLSAQGSKKYFILLAKEDVRSQMTGAVKYLQGYYSANLVEAAPVVSALSMTRISLKESVLNFDLGPVAVRDLIGFKLNVTHKILLGRNEVIFDRELTQSEIELEARGAGSDAKVNIERLGVKMAQGKHALTATAFYKHEGRLLNESQFERVSAERTLIIKNR